MELTKRDKILLAKAVDDRALEIMQMIASQMLANWAAGPICKETTLLTIKEAAGRDERKRALQSFLQELERLAHED